MRLATQSILAWGWLVAGLLAVESRAQTAPAQQDALQWLQKVATAAQKLNYSGTFVFQNGRRSETSRIVHVATADGRQMEKLEVLDGSPREVIWQNGEVACYLPDRRLVIIEQRGARRSFPALLPPSLAGLGEYYTIRKGGTARIAGIDSQIVRIEPRDAWRYGRTFWADQETGLLLKADTLDAAGEPLELLAFTELQIGMPANPDAIKPSFGQKPDWEVKQAQVREVRDDAQWQFRNGLPGFRRQAAMQRILPGGPGESARAVLHWVYSDGLAALSVFISPLQPQATPAEGGVQTMGAISIFNRIVDGHQVVVMGDVPPVAIKRFADGIGVRGK
jgi:sigma-E factor negative regulatory protein RseB